jgi:hypothetical protein
VTTRIHSVNSPRKSSRSLGIVASLSLLGLTLATAHCADQPKVRCGATSGEVIARYRAPGTDWTKIAVPTGTCDSVSLPLRGEGFGIQTYVPNPADSNAHDEVNSLAIKATWLGDRIADARDNAGNPDQNPDLKAQDDVLANYPYGTATPPDPPPDGPPSTNFPYVFGKFTTPYPDGNDVCAVPSVTVSDVTYPDIPAHNIPDPNADPAADPQPPWVPSDDQPETKVKYEWSNVRVIVNADSIGTQTFGDLTITQDGCSITVQASLLSPKVGCTDANKKADPTMCDPLPTDANPYGSGIGQGIPTECVDIAVHTADPKDPNNPDPDFECVPTKFAP